MHNHHLKSKSIREYSTISLYSLLSTHLELALSSETTQISIVKLSTALFILSAAVNTDAFMRCTCVGVQGGPDKFKV